MNNEEKLKNFEVICRNEARRQKNELEEQINLKTQGTIQEELEIYRQKQENKKNNQLLKLEKNFNSALWQLENEYKRKLEQEKENLKNILYEELKLDLIKYTESEQYVEYLKKNIEKNAKELGQTENITILVTKKDKEKYLDYLESLRYNIETMEDSFIGGTIAKSQDKLVNNTLLENLKERIHEYESNI